jgi:hypothetical protein
MDTRVYGAMTWNIQSILHSVYLILQAKLPHQLASTPKIPQAQIFCLNSSAT